MQHICKRNVLDPVSGGRWKRPVFANKFALMNDLQMTAFVDTTKFYCLTTRRSDNLALDCLLCLMLLSSRHKRGNWSRPRPNSSFEPSENDRNEATSLASTPSCSRPLHTVGHGRMGLLRFLRGQMPPMSLLGEGPDLPRTGPFDRLPQRSHLHRGPIQG